MLKKQSNRGNIKVLSERGLFYRYSLLFSFIFFIFNLNFISSLPSDSTNIDFEYTTPTNYSLVNVNNSDYLDGYDSSYFYPYSNPFSFYNITNIGNVLNTSYYVPYSGATANLNISLKNISTNAMSIGANTLTNSSKLFISGAPAPSQALINIYNSQVATTQSAIDFNGNDNGGMVYRFYRNGVYSGGLGIAAAGSSFYTAPTNHFFYTGAVTTPSSLLVAQINGAGLRLGVPSGDTGGGTIHLHNTSGTAYPYIHITDPTTTTTAASGVKFGLDASHNLIINHQNSYAQIFYTNNTERMRISNAGLVTFTNNVTSPNLCYSNGSNCNPTPNIFNQTLNTTSNVTFANVNITANLHIDGNFSAKRPYWNGYDNSTQNFLNTSETQIMNISNNNDYDSYYISIEGSSNLTFAMTGDYLCIVSPEFTNTAVAAQIAFWYEKWNGTTWNQVRWSNSRYTIGNGEYLAPAIPFQFDIETPATEKVRFMWYSTSTNSQIVSIAPPTSPARPGVPGVILNCQKVSEIT